MPRACILWVAARELGSSLEDWVAPTCAPAVAMDDMHSRPCRPTQAPAHVEAARVGWRRGHSGWLDFFPLKVGRSAGCAGAVRLGRDPKRWPARRACQEVVHQPRLLCACCCEQAMPPGGPESPLCLILAYCVLSWKQTVQYALTEVLKLSKRIGAGSELHGRGAWGVADGRHAGNCCCARALRLGRCKRVAAPG